MVVTTIKPTPQPNEPAVRPPGRLVRLLPFRGRSLASRLVVLALLVVIGLNLTAAGLFGWAEYHLRKGRAHAARFEFAPAYEHLQKGLYVWRRSAPLHFEAAQAARRSEAYRDAEKLLDACQRLQGGVSEPLQLERLLLRAEAGDIAAVETGLWECVKAEQPETPLILESLCCGYLRQMRYGTALYTANKLLDRQPNNVRVLYWRGWIREHTEHPTEAIVDYRRVVELLPDHDDARLHLAGLLIRASPEEALTHLRRLQQRKPDSPDVLVTLAQCHRALGEAEQAEKLIEDVLAAHPDQVQALVERGALAVEQGDAAGGEPWLRRAVELEPYNRNTQHYLYRCLLQQPGREAEAERQEAKLKQVTADLVRLHEILMGKMDTAPTDPALQHEVGAIFLRAGDEKLGLQWLYQALKFDPDFQPAHKTLADYFQRKGDTERAAQHRQRIRPEPKGDKVTR